MGDKERAVRTINKKQLHTTIKRDDEGDEMVVSPMTRMEIKYSRERRRT